MGSNELFISCHVLGSVDAMLRFIHAIGSLKLAVLVPVHACIQQIILAFVCATSGKNCSPAKTARRAHPRPQHTSKKTPKTHASGSPPPPIPMALLDPMPSPFGGRPRNSRATSRYPSLTLLSKRTARFSLFLMNNREVLHQRGFFAVPIVARPFNPFGGRDSRFQCRSFRRTRAFEWFLCDEKKIQTLLHLNRWSNDHRRFILPPTPNTHTSINFNWLIILSVV